MYRNSTRTAGSPSKERIKTKVYRFLGKQHPNQNNNTKGRLLKDLHPTSTNKALLPYNTDIMEHAAVVPLPSVQPNVCLSCFARTGFQMKLFSRFALGLTKDLVESIRLLDTQEPNAKNQNQGKDGHDDAPNSHGKQKERDKQVHHIPTTKREEMITKLGSLQPLDDGTRSLNGNEQHHQTGNGCQSSHQNVQIVGLGRKSYANDNVEHIEQCGKRAKGSCETMFG
mmetsp:Transcript_31061/g.71583  ORF Transcript_31061/g.71583 Transcript_31061/m.71583 type:complete len:226 (+) Transcript_31061:79-756(+)